MQPLMGARACQPEGATRLSSSRPLAAKWSLQHICLVNSTLHTVQTTSHPALIPRCAAHLPHAASRPAATARAAPPPGSQARRSVQWLSPMVP